MLDEGKYSAEVIRGVFETPEAALAGIPKLIEYRIPLSIFVERKGDWKYDLTLVMMEDYSK